MKVLISSILFVISLLWLIFGTFFSAPGVESTEGHEEIESVDGSHLTIAKPSDQRLVAVREFAMSSRGNGPSDIYWAGLLDKDACADILAEIKAGRISKVEMYRLAQICWQIHDSSRREILWEVSERLKIDSLYEMLKYPPVDVRNAKIYLDDDVERLYYLYLATRDNDLLLRIQELRHCVNEESGPRQKVGHAAQGYCDRLAIVSGN